MADRTANSNIWGRHTTLEQDNMATSEFPSRPPSYREYDGPYEDGFPRASRSSSIERLSDCGMVRRVNTGSNFSCGTPAIYGDIQNRVARSQEESIGTIHFQDSDDIMVLEALEVEKASGGPPDCFANVIPGVYRSSFPQAKDHEFLKTLDLKTIVTLVEKEYPDGFVEFMQENGIRHCIVAMQGTKKESIPQETMRSIMDILLDTANHPVLVHCNKGKHRTGCSVAAIRHASGWKVEDIVNEYEAFAEPKIRDCDVKYIKQYQVSDVEKGLYYNLVPQNGMQPPQPVLLSSSMVPYYVVAAFLIFIICVCTPYGRA